MCPIQAGCRFRPTLRQAWLSQRLSLADEEDEVGWLASCNMTMSNQHLSLTNTYKCDRINGSIPRYDCLKLYPAPCFSGTELWYDVSMCQCCATILGGATPYGTPKVQSLPPWNQHSCYSCLDPQGMGVEANNSLVPVIVPLL